MPRLRLSLSFLVLMAAAPAVLRAQVTTPQPILTSISPAAIQVGTTAEISITGTDLDGATRLHFSAPGITCEPKLDDKKQPVPNKFAVSIPDGMAATTCDVRVVARYGISNPRGLVITPLPVAVAPDSATSADKAIPVSLNTTITGAAVKQAASFIRFDAKQGQRVIAVCRPIEIDSRMDAHVALRNADGVKLARLQPDGILDFTVPADGAYTLEVHDLMFRGDAEHPFVLTLTTRPVIQYAFDGGDQWTLYGHNLANGSCAATVSANKAKRLLAANPVTAIRFGAQNDPPADSPPPVALQFPAEYTGWFAPRGKAREFTFEAKKGDALWIEVNCAGKGVAADPILVVERDGAFIAEANDRPAVTVRGEFDSGVADPSYRFEAKEDGVYRVKLRNQFAQSPQEPFELTVRPAGDEYELVALPCPPPKAKTSTTVEITAAPLWRGGVAVLKVVALRRGGFTGAIELEADGLPAGVKYLGGFIREGQSAGYAFFQADETAEPWAGAVKLHGKDGAPARGATVLFKVGNTNRDSTLTRLTDEVVLAVTPSDAPVTIDSANPVVESDGVAKLSIPLKAVRRGDFTDAISFTSLGVEGLTATIPAKASEGTLAVDVAKLKLPAGDHPVVLQSIVKFKHQRGDDPKTAAKDVTFLVHAKPVIIRVKPPEKKS